MAVRPPDIARDGRNEDSELGERWLRNGASSWRPQGADDDEADLRRFWKAVDEVPSAATDRLERPDIRGAEWRDGVAPEPALLVSEWDDRHHILGSRGFAEPRPWRTTRTPYLSEIMDALSPAHPVWRVVFMKNA